MSIAREERIDFFIRANLTFLPFKRVEKCQCLRTLRPVFFANMSYFKMFVWHFFLNNLQYYFLIHLFRDPHKSHYSFFRPQCRSAPWWAFPPFPDIMARTLNYGDRDGRRGRGGNVFFCYLSSILLFCLFCFSTHIHLNLYWDHGIRIKHINGNILSLMTFYS